MRKLTVNFPEQTSLKTRGEQKRVNEISRVYLRHHSECMCVSLTHFTTPSEAFRVNSLAPVLPTDIGELTTPEEKT